LILLFYSKKIENYLALDPQYMAVSTKLPSTAPLVPENKLALDNLTAEDIQEINIKLIERINQVIKLSGTASSSLNLCLAILYFMNGDYKNSVFHFETILKLDPNNYSIWNKIAATKAHLGDFEESKKAYEKALDVKPNYVRSWTNLSINYHSLNQLDTSASFLLNAIALNPDARHLWSYLESVFIHQNIFERLQLTSKMDISKFADMHNVKSVKDLPPPNGGNYSSLFQQYVLKGDIDEWVNQFNPSNNDSGTNSS
jgi:peroxin-5